MLDNAFMIANDLFFLKAKSPEAASYKVETKFNLLFQKRLSEIWTASSAYEAYLPVSQLFVWQILYLFQSQLGVSIHLRRKTNFLFLFCFSGILYKLAYWRI